MSDLFPINRDQLYALAARGELSGYCADDAPREMTREDLGYDKRVQRTCFHGGCILDASACAMTCIGCQPFTFTQSRALWAAKHGTPKATPDAPYAFWLGADAPKPIPYLPAQWPTYADWSIL